MQIISQPYYNYEGHFRHYTDNLDNLYNHKNLPLKTINLLKVPDKKNLLRFIFWRFLLAFKNYSYFIRKKPTLIHIVDFEPLSFLLLYLFINRKIKFIITVHSVQAGNSLPDKFQKIILMFAFKRLEQRFGGAVLVVHDSENKRLLNKFLPKLNVSLINYPGTNFNIKSSNTTPTKLIIFGALRKDKDPKKFLKICNMSGYEIEHLGRVDEEIVPHMGKIKFKNEYISKTEIAFKLSEARFILLPYGEKYKGGAGPIKDALVNGIPVLAMGSFRYKTFVQDNKIGFVFNNTVELQNIIRNLNKREYEEIRNKCIREGSKYTWKAMQEEYSELVNSQLSIKEH